MKHFLNYYSLHYNRLVVKNYFNKSKSLVYNNLEYL